MQQAYLGVNVAKVAIPALERAVAAARANYDQVDGRFKQGLADSVELADAEETRRALRPGNEKNNVGETRERSGIVRNQ